MKTEQTLRTFPKGHTYYKNSDCPACPTCEAAKKPKDGFLSLLFAPARRALESSGITTIEQLSKYTRQEILSLHGIGKSLIPVLEKALFESKLSFKDNLLHE